MNLKNKLKSSLLLFGLFFIFSCSNIHEEWSELDTDKISIEELETTFGKPIEIDLLEYRLDHLRYLDKKFVYFGDANPQSTNEKLNKKINNQSKIKLLKQQWKYGNYLGKLMTEVNLFEELSRLTYYGVSDHNIPAQGVEAGSCTWRDPKKNASYCHNELLFSIEELVQGVPSDSIKCLGCRNLQKIIEDLGEYVFVTTKRDWIKELKKEKGVDFDKFSREQVMINKGMNLNGQGDAHLIPTQIDKGIRYEFTLDNDIAIPWGYLPRVSSTGIIEEISFPTKGRTEEVIFKVTEQSKTEINEIIKDSDWIYGDKNDPIGAYRFNQDKTFSYSSGMFGGFSKKGTWNIDDEGDIITYTTWSSNDEGYGNQWIHLISKNELTLDGSDSVYKKI